MIGEILLDIIAQAKYHIDLILISFVLIFFEFISTQIIQASKSSDVLNNMTQIMNITNNRIAAPQIEFGCTAIKIGSSRRIGSKFIFFH